MSTIDIRGQLEIFTVCIEDYDWNGIGAIKESYQDSLISNKLRTKLNELLDLAIEYFKWRNESIQVINSEVTAISKFFYSLSEAIREVYGVRLEDLFQVKEGGTTQIIYKAIFQNKLTFNLAKETILKGCWDQNVHVTDKEGNNIEMKFQEIINGSDFHKFIEKLGELQRRYSIVTLGNSRENFLNRSKIVIKELENA